MKFEDLRRYFVGPYTFILVRDSNGRYVYISPEMESIVGIPAESLMGKDNFELFGPEQATAWQEEDDKAIYIGTNSFHTIVVDKYVDQYGKNRQFLDVRLRMKFDESDEAYLVTINTEILTEQPSGFDIAMAQLRGTLLSLNNSISS